MFSWVLLSCLLAFVGLSSDDEDSFVVTLTEENFESFIAEHPNVLVEFYAPWCGHCKALAPEYEKAATALNADEDVKTKLAKVDATEEKNLATKFGIKGFPTLKYFSGGSDKYVDYGGGRTEATIVSWIKKRELPAVSELKSSEDVEKFQAKDKVVLVGYLAEDSEEAAALRDTGDKNRDSKTKCLVTDESVAKELGANFGSVYLYRQVSQGSLDEASVEFTGESINGETLSAFLQAERFPLIDEIGPENYKDYMDRGLPLVWIAVDPSKEEEKTAFINLLAESAKATKGELSFTWINAVQYAQHVQNLGIASPPGLIIISENDKYLYQGSTTDKDEIAQFFTDYKQGKLNKFLKSEDIPETNDESVYVLVGKTFDTMVGKDKDVLVEFYAPWCGHCKKLAPEYTKLGDAFKDVDDLLIAKIDATENDTSEDIKGFPTLIFYPKGQTTGEKYNGDRTAKALAEWLKTKSTAEGATNVVHDEL